jgi:hypothetical protein
MCSDMLDYHPEFPAYIQPFYTAKHFEASTDGLISRWVYKKIEDRCDEF